MKNIGIQGFKEEMEKKLAKESSINKLAIKEKMIKKQFSLTDHSYKKLIKGERKFVRNHMMASLGFVTGFTDCELNHIYGYAIVK